MPTDETVSLANQDYFSAHKWYSHLSSPDPDEVDFGVHVGECILELSAELLHPFQIPLAMLLAVTQFITPRTILPLAAEVV